MRSLWRRLVPTRFRPAVHRFLHSWVFEGSTAGRGQWIRLEMDDATERYIEQLGGAQALDALEVSGDLHTERPWGSYRRVEYPAFDLTAPPEELDEHDLVLCEQVLEHVVDPVTAVRTLLRLTRPGGHLIVSTPFMIRIHASPDDYWRFTPKGLRVLLGHCGFEVVDLGAWGNGQAIRANFRHWRPRPWWGSMKNDPDLPVSVWALARRPL